MAQAQKGRKSRPLSPHLGIWRWGPHMAISILHRITGDGLAIVGAMALVWWLVAAASGPAFSRSPASNHDIAAIVRDASRYSTGAPAASRARSAAWWSRAASSQRPCW